MSSVAKNKVLYGNANVTGNMPEQRWRDVAPLVIRSSGGAAIGMAKLNVGSTLPYADKAPCGQ